MTTPFLYQLQDVRKVHRFRGRSLVSWEMGLGKTLLAIMHATRHPELRPVIVVCPAGIKWQWQAEFSRHGGIAAQVLEGTRPPLNETTIIPQAVIVNYDILGQRQSQGAGKGWMSWLKTLNAQLVIIDETQNLGSAKAKRTKWTRELCKDVPSILALSGTPLTNRPLELWPTLNILWPDEFPALWPYCFRYCAPKKTMWGWDFSGASHIDELHKKLTTLGMIRRKKEDVLSQLPAKQRMIVPLDLEDRKQYDHAVKDFLGWIAKTNPAKLGKVIKAEWITRLGYLIRLAGQLKLPAVLNWIDNFLTGTDEKLIVFAVHRLVINRIKECYQEQCVVVDGSVNARDRQLAVHQFLNRDKTRLFIGNIKAAGVGWSAKGVSNVAFAELAWTPGEHAQAEDRVRGIGRGKKGTKAMIWYLLARNTIEEKLADVNQKKQEVISKVLDGSGKVNRFDLADLLTQSLIEGEQT